MAEKLSIMAAYLFLNNHGGTTEGNLILLLWSWNISPMSSLQKTLWSQLVRGNIGCSSASLRGSWKTVTASEVPHLAIPAYDSWLSASLHILWLHVDNLKLATVKVSTKQKSANISIQCLLSFILIEEPVYQYTTGHSHFTENKHSIKDRIQF